MRNPTWHRLRALAVAAGIAAGMLAGSLSSPSFAFGVGPLPACKIDDVLTVPRGYDDWQTTLVDWSLSVGPDYRPPDLVSVRKGGVGGGGLVRSIVIEDLQALAAAAAKNGTPLVAWSPYRGYSQQQKLFNGYAGWNGTKYTNFDSAITYSARPGHSEHQLGTTIDFVAVGDTGLTSNWEVTPTGGWMARNAWKYGWLMSYPKGKQDVVCYRYEPWHYRYYGRELAKAIHDSGLTTREYLWANYTQLNTSLEAVATTAPSASASGAPEASAAPSSTAANEPSMGPIGGSSGANAASTPAPTVDPAPTPSGFSTASLFWLVVVVLAAVGVVAGLGVFLLNQNRRRAPPR